MEGLTWAQAYIVSSGSDFSLECDCLPTTPRKAAVSHPVSFNLLFIELSVFALEWGCVVVCMSVREQRGS